eukprot:4222704-Amphidinium_carterae.1
MGPKPISAPAVWVITLRCHVEVSPSPRPYLKEKGRAGVPTELPPRGMSCLRRDVARLAGLLRRMMPARDTGTYSRAADRTSCYDSAS